MSEEDEGEVLITVCQGFLGRCSGALSDGEPMTKARWVRDENGDELLEFDPPLEMDGAYKAVKLPRLSVGFLMDEWFAVEFLLEETKG